MEELLITIINKREQYMKEIKPIENINNLSTLQPIYLNCILMANNEVIFCGKSLGFLTEEELKKWAFIDKGE